VVGQVERNLADESGRWTLCGESDADVDLLGFLINSCKIKHKRINNNNNNNTLVSGINGQGLNGAKNALALWNEFCRWAKCATRRLRLGVTHSKDRKDVVESKKSAKSKDVRLIL
jgi:hypothetical protein